MNLLFKNSSLRDLPLLNRPETDECRIRANNDAEAIERWLDEYFDRPATFRTYKKEAERFLVWCVTSRSTSLWNLNREDVVAYQEFLKNPMPKEKWCGSRRRKGAHGPWYPFAGPLSDSAIKTAMASLNSLMTYLVEARYLDFNPFTLVKSKNRFRPKADQRAFEVHERILEDGEWKALLDTIEEEPADDAMMKYKKDRLRFLFKILFFLGLRIDELCRATWQDCKKIDGLWWFFVLGKGNRLGKIPINSQLLQEIMSYRHALEKAPMPRADDPSPLIARFNSQKALSVRQMSNLIKDIAIKTAQKFPEGSPSHRKLLRFSPHWLRHLSASKQDQAGISFTNIKSNLRHQNEQTTRIYVHAYDTDRHREMEKLRI